VIPQNGMHSFSSPMDLEMVQSVIHDLRAPMTVIKGYLQLLLSGVMGEMSSEQTKVIERSVGPLEELILMTENLLQSTSLQRDDVELKPKDVDLDSLLAETIEFYRLAFKQRGMQLYRDGNTLGLTIKVDPYWFKRVLTNLIWNAYKFTPDGGKVTVVVNQKPTYLEIAIHDTGRGIPSDRIHSIFEKFSQASPKNDVKMGQGLGLWICKRIMELHGGTIRVESKNEIGSTFYLEIPLYND
jgi:two-component system, NtrC family, sensor kinase